LPGLAAGLWVVIEAGGASNSVLLPELPAFSRVLKALPADAVDYKPHERTPMAQQIVWTLTNELQACVDVVTQNKAEWKPLPPPPLPEMVQLSEGPDCPVLYNG
jgi:hypothetical protein